MNAEEARGKYPMIERHGSALPSMGVITDFLDWLWENKRYELAAWKPSGQSMLPVLEGRERLLQEYFEIDATALENERRAMLAARQKDEKC